MNRKPHQATLTGRSRPHADGSTEWEAECDDGELRWFSDSAWKAMRVMKVTLPESSPRRPSAKWAPAAGRPCPDSPVIMALDIKLGRLTLRAYADNYGGNWSVEARDQAGTELKAIAGGGSEEGVCSVLLESAQLKAENALESFLTDALAELRGGR